MLLFIFCICHNIIVFTILSIHPMLLFIAYSEAAAEDKNNFNTSHVTVYRGYIAGQETLSEFQYIPCYCLS